MVSIVPAHRDPLQMASLRTSLDHESLSRLLEDPRSKSLVWPSQTRPRPSRQNSTGNVRSVLIVTSEHYYAIIMETHSISLNEFDVAVLFAIPQPGADLRMLLAYYISIHRDACPAFEEIAASLQKAQEAAIVFRNGDRFRVSDEWYKRIHRHDDSAGNEIESLLLFQDEVLGESISHRLTVDPLMRDEYDRAVSQLVMR